MSYSPEAITDAVSTRLREVDPELHKELNESGKLGEFLDNQLLAFHRTLVAEKARNKDVAEELLAETVLKEIILPSLEPVASEPA